MCWIRFSEGLAGARGADFSVFSYQGCCCLAVCLLSLFSYFHGLTGILVRHLRPAGVFYLRQGTSGDVLRAAVKPGHGT